MKQARQGGMARKAHRDGRAGIGALLTLGLWWWLWGNLAGAADAGTWATVADPIKIQMANPVRNRRNPDAKFDIKLANSAAAALPGPLRLVLGSLTPADKVTISNASGQTAAGEPYFDLAPYLGGNDFPALGNAVVTVTVLGGGPVNFDLKPRVEQFQSAPVPLAVKITAPASLITVGHSPLSVQGILAGPASLLTLNGVPLPARSGPFSAEIALREGHNVVVARAVGSDGQEVTDSISVSLDMTPPYVTIDSPKDGDEVYAPAIAVSGLVNDIVRGTVAEGQANVLVNGVAATVANRAYSAVGVPLVEGDNTLTVRASDAVGNVGSASLRVVYKKPGAQRIETLSGDQQKAVAGTVLADPLKVRLLDAQGKPARGKPVVFRVTQGDGMVGVGGPDEGRATLATTGADGIAATAFRLGMRAGAGNQRVRVAAVGFDGEALFAASADPAAGDKVSVNSGNNQRGAVGQPLPLPFVAVVTDAGANVVAGVPVEFKVTQGGGKFQNGQASVTVATDSDGRASAQMTLGPEEGLDVQAATATLGGTQLYAGFTASGLKTGDPGDTRITGAVLDNQDNPLPQVAVRVEGTTRQAVTDAQGRFVILNAPIGPVHLIVDGSTTTVPGEWPALPFNLVTIAGAENPLPAPVHLVKLDTGHAVEVGGEDVTLTLPEVPGFALEVKAGSVTFPDGKKTGKLSVTPVNADKVPMPPPNGMQPQLIVTIQPTGARFDPPARLTLPNVDGHRPGAQVEMYSFDHDLEEFVTIGLGTVSADGSVVQSNPGTGVVKAGWHCGSQPDGQGCCKSECHNCPLCWGCTSGPDCSGSCSDPLSNDLVDEDLKDCKKPVCKQGKQDFVVAYKQRENCEECNKDGTKTLSPTNRQCCDRSLAGAKKVGGRAICCSEKAIPCVWPQNFPKSKSGNALSEQYLYDCTLMHEQLHADRHVKCKENDCNIDYNPPTDEEKAANECEASKAEKQCYLSKIKMCGNDQICIDNMNYFISIFRVKTPAFQAGRFHLDSLKAAGMMRHLLGRERWTTATAVTRSTGLNTTLSG